MMFKQETNALIKDLTLEQTTKFNQNLRYTSEYSDMFIFLNKDFVNIDFLLQY